MHHTGLVADARVKKHATPRGHPEQPARFSAVMSRLEWSGLIHDLVRLPSRFATNDELALAHRRQYIDLVDVEVAAHRAHLSTGDTESAQRVRLRRVWPQVACFRRLMRYSVVRCKMRFAWCGRRAITQVLHRHGILLINTLQSRRAMPVKSMLRNAC